MVTGRMVFLIIIGVVFLTLLGLLLHGRGTHQYVRPEHLTGEETNVKTITLTPEEYQAIIPCLAEYWRQFDPTIPCWENVYKVCDGRGVDST